MGDSKAWAETEKMATTVGIFAETFYSEDLSAMMVKFIAD